MNRFHATKQKSHMLRDVVLTIIIAFCTLSFLIIGARTISRSAQESQLSSLKEALQRSALHCYSVEGTYPESLDYLKEHYGISWNEEEYLVDYEVLGANLMPGITVFARRTA